MLAGAGEQRAEAVEKLAPSRSDAGERGRRVGEVRRPHRLAYTSLVDFVPDRAPYDHLTTVDLEEADGGTRVVMTVGPMYDPVWTQRLVDGRANEIDNLARLVRAD